MLDRVSVCAIVCVCERERARESARESDREKETACEEIEKGFDWNSLFLNLLFDIQMMYRLCFLKNNFEGFPKINVDNSNGLEHLLRVNISMNFFLGGEVLCIEKEERRSKTIA